MIEMVTLAEERLREIASRCSRPRCRRRCCATGDVVAPLLRGACAEPDGKSRRRVAAAGARFPHQPAILAYVNGAELKRYAQARRRDARPYDPHQELPLIVPAPDAGDLAGFARGGRARRRRISSPPITPISRATTRAASRRSANSTRCRASRWCRASGFSAWDAAKRTRASPPISPRTRYHHHRCRSDRRASKRCPKRSFSRWNTGRWSRRSSAARRRSRSRARSRRSPAAPARSARRAPSSSRRMAPRSRCSIATATARRRPRRSSAARRSASPATSPTMRRVRGAFEKVAAHFGGLDILISNAGAAWQGKIGEVEEAVLRESFELNFFAHQTRRASRGEDHAGARDRRLPALQRLEAGDQSRPRFRPYGLPKAATLVPLAAIRARLRQGRHPRQRGQCRPHPQRLADAAR